MDDSTNLDKLKKDELKELCIKLLASKKELKTLRAEDGNILKEKMEEIEKLKQDLRIQGDALKNLGTQAEMVVVLEKLKEEKEKYKKQAEETDAENNKIIKKLEELDKLNKIGRAHV